VRRRQVTTLVHDLHAAGDGSRRSQTSPCRKQQDKGSVETKQRNGVRPPRGLILEDRRELRALVKRIRVVVLNAGLFHGPDGDNRSRHQQAKGTRYYSLSAVRKSRISDKT